MLLRIPFLCALALVYLAVYIALDGFAGQAQDDEVWFWAATLFFTDGWIPSLEQLSTYPALNTPLPFIVWACLERLTHGGIDAARASNHILSYAMVALIVLTGRNRDWRVVAAAVGLLLFPYYVYLGTRLYTDTMAAAFALLGIWCWSRRQNVFGAIAFALAIATRQYMLAFPLAVALYELGRHRRLNVAWIAPACGAATILFWYFLFGGFAPPNEVTRQQIPSSFLALSPDHGLYILTCVGAFFVLPEMVLLLRRPRLREICRPTVIVGVLTVITLFVIFPPVRNATVFHRHEHLGMMDRHLRPSPAGSEALTLGIPDTPRMVLYAALAILPLLRFPRLGLPLLLIVLNAGILMKGHIAWDKYALALLTCLWFLSADERGADVGAVTGGDTDAVTDPVTGGDTDAVTDAAKGVGAGVGAERQPQ